MAITGEWKGFYLGWKSVARGKRIRRGNKRTMNHPVICKHLAIGVAQVQAFLKFHGRAATLQETKGLEKGWRRRESSETSASCLILSINVSRIVNGVQHGGTVNDISRI